MTATYPTLFTVQTNDINDLAHDLERELGMQRTRRDAHTDVRR